MPRSFCLFAFVPLLVVFAAACGGDDDGDGEPAATATAVRTVPAGETPDAAPPDGDGTPAQGETTVAATPVDGASSGVSPSAPPPSGGRSVSADEAAAILDAIVLKPIDVAGEWSIQNDTTVDNESAAAQNPDQASSIERCGRLLGRTVVLQPTDTVTRYIGGEAVSFFTNVTVFATAAGAADCAAEAAVRFQDQGELVKAFGSLFVRPQEVTVTPVQFPALGDGSFAVTLSGLISAAGNEVNITILVVGFLRGNVSVAVGSAAAYDPDPAELQRFVELTLERVDQVLR